MAASLGAARNLETPCFRATDNAYRLPDKGEIVGKTLEAHAREYRDLLDDPLFEIASHTWSHKMLRDHPWCGPAASAEQIWEEIFRGKEIVERVFERPCLGLRPGCSFDVGLRGAPNVLRLVADARFRYVSSLLWGPGVFAARTVDRAVQLRRRRLCGFVGVARTRLARKCSENHHRWGSRRLTLWPAMMPEAVPSNFVKTTDDEFAINRIFLEQALARQLPFVSLIWHPWSLDRFDPEMKMLELTFVHARELGLQPSTYAQVWRKITEKKI
jgi:hypothetical protein